MNVNQKLLLLDDKQICVYVYLKKTNFCISLLLPLLIGIKLHRNFQDFHCIIYFFMDKNFVEYACMNNNFLFKKGP